MLVVSSRYATVNRLIIEKYLKIIYCEFETIKHC